MVRLAGRWASSKAARHTVVGDGRRNLGRPGRQNFYHVLVVDAFHSGAIPMHLLTREALGLYFQKLELPVLIAEAI